MQFNCQQNVDCIPKQIMDMKTGIAPIVPSYHPINVSESIMQTCSFKKCPNTEHAEILVSLAVLIANAKTCRGNPP